MLDLLRKLAVILESVPVLQASADFEAEWTGIFRYYIQFEDASMTLKVDAMDLLPLVLQFKTVDRAEVCPPIRS